MSKHTDIKPTQDRRTGATRGLGPGLLVAAAFVGPGTVATASSAGASFGYALIWALGFSVFATIVLQEMSARSAIVTRLGLAANLRQALGQGLVGRIILLLVILAIGVGNAAYESGNIAGAALALAGVSGVPGHLWAIAIGAMAGALLFIPAYRDLERVLIALVLGMSVIFVTSAILLAPDWRALAAGFAPGLPSGSGTLVIALIGTTVVPYNLFLHANAAREHWGHARDREGALTAARYDTVLSVTIGGLITLSIVSIAASGFFLAGEAFSSDALLDQLEPVLGSAGRYVFAAGLWAAGLTSAVAAPLAAAYAVCGSLGLEDTLRGRAFRGIALTVVAIGTLFAATGARPLSLIVFAQATNGLLLPLIAVVLLWMMNQESLLRSARNGPWTNALGLIVVLIAIALGANKLLSLLPA